MYEQIAIKFSYGNLMIFVCKLTYYCKQLAMRLKVFSVLFCTENCFWKYDHKTSTFWLRFWLKMHLHCKNHKIIVNESICAAPAIKGLFQRCIASGIHGIYFWTLNCQNQFGCNIWPLHALFRYCIIAKLTTKVHMYYSRVIHKDQYLIFWPLGHF